VSNLSKAITIKEIRKSPNDYCKSGRLFGDKWVLDEMGPKMKRLSRKDGGHHNIVVCVEKLTIWIELIPLRNLHTSEVADEIISNLIARFHYSRLVYDQQSSYISILMQTVLKSLRVTSSIAHSWVPLKNSNIAEKYIRTIELCLKNECMKENKLAENVALASIFA